MNEAQRNCIGVSERAAAYTAQNLSRSWDAAHSPGLNHAMPVAYFDRLGLPRLA